MTKVFHGSYVVCALLGILQLFMFFEAYLRAAMGIYHPVIILTSGMTSLLLLASLFLPLRARIVALLMFAGCTISTYVWSMGNSPIDPTGMSFSEGLLQGLLFIVFALLPTLGVVSGASLMRQHADRKE